MKFRTLASIRFAGTRVIGVARWCRRVCIGCAGTIRVGCRRQGFEPRRIEFVYSELKDSFIHPDRKSPSCID